MVAPRIVAMKAGQNDTSPRPTRPPIPTSTTVLGENKPMIGKASPADTIKAVAIARFGCSPIKFSRSLRYAVTAMPSAPRSSCHVCKEDAGAAQQQDASRRQRNAWNQNCRHRGKPDNRHDLEGERAIVNKQAEQLAKDRSQCVHGKTSALGRRAEATAASPTARNSAANMMIARSAPGQATPRPSPVQKMPNAAS